MRHSWWRMQQMLVAPHLFLNKKTKKKKRRSSWNYYAMLRWWYVTQAVKSEIRGHMLSNFPIYSTFRTQTAKSSRERALGEAQSSSGDEITKEKALNYSFPVLSFLVEMSWAIYTDLHHAIKVNCEVVWNIGQRFHRKTYCIWCMKRRATPSHVLVDSGPNLGSFTSRWEINKFENCWYKGVRILEVKKLLFQHFFCQVPNEIWVVQY
jgi:hypothetical protein